MTIKKLLISLFLSLFFSPCNSQSLIGKWVEVNGADDPNKLWIIDNMTIAIYASESKTWVAGLYKTENEILALQLLIDNEVQSMSATYRFLGNTLVINDGYAITHFQKGEFEEPLFEETESAKGGETEQALETSGVLIVKPNTTFQLNANMTSIKLDKIELGDFSKLVIPQDQVALYIEVDAFVAGRGSEIIGIGKPGDCPIIKANLEAKAYSASKYLLQTCANGVSGKDGLNGQSGGPGCSLVIKANTIDVKGLHVSLRGGDGQKGEDGEKGGNGGNGTCNCSAGNGGSNGIGGIGGNGGNGGNFTLKYGSGNGIALITVSNLGGLGGSPGNSGLPGYGGTGLYCSDYNSQNGLNGFNKTGLSIFGRDGMQGILKFKKI